MDRAADGTPVLVAEVVSHGRNTTHRDSLVRAWTAQYRPHTRLNYRLMVGDWLAFIDHLGIDWLDVRRSHVELWGRERRPLALLVAHRRGLPRQGPDQPSASTSGR